MTVRSRFDARLRTWTELPARLAALAAAIWLMAAPAVLEYDGAAAANDRIVGPIAGSFAFVACWEVLMAMRWPTLPLGLWLLVAPIVFGYPESAMWVSSMVSGLVIAAAAFVGHDTRSEFDGGWSSVRPSAWRLDAS